MTNIQPPMENFERPDPVLTNKIVTHLKSQGIFDQFRRECMADVDTKPAYHNLRQRVEGSVAAFLRLNPWRPDMNKNQLRDNLRKHIQSGGFLDVGVDRIVDQVVNPKIYTVFLPKVEEVVESCLGMENDKPKFEPPPVTEVKSEQPKFQDKHNLAPRAKLPAPLMGPILKPLKPPDPVEKSLPTEEKIIDNGGDIDVEEAGDKKYVVDEDDPEEKEEEEDDDDEESPPFEPHSEGDRMILGMRSDTSENSNDSQVVTTVVDDSYEETIDNTETVIKEESDKKDEDSSSDEYVPKTPTINMEESDGTVLEFNSISEYKQYQTKFEEESFGNVEEVVASQSMNNTSDNVKERNSNEDDFGSGSQKRKFDIDSYDDVSSSNSDGESTGDEIKPAVFESFARKRYKLEEYEQDNETSEMSINDADNEDSYTERSLDVPDSKLKALDSEHLEKPKGSSTSSKDSGKSHHTPHKELKESSNTEEIKDRPTEKERHEKTKSSHSSKDKKDSHKKSEKHESSRDKNKERDRKRSESSSKNEKERRSKHHDKDKERDKGKKISKSSEKTKTDKEDECKVRKESRHEHKDHHESRSRTADTEKKKYHARDRLSDGREDHESAHKNDKDKRDGSKHHHSSSRHSHHRSSSEKHKSDKDHKHSSDRHKSIDKKSDKESKDEAKKKYRQHCKYSNDKNENRRSSDRDSSGPSERTYTSVSLKTTSSRSHRESNVESGERTTSNSDNTVSDSIEVLQNCPNEKIQHEAVSPDFQLVGDCWNESDHMESDWDHSKEEQDQQNIPPNTENMTPNDFNDAEKEKEKCSIITEDENEVGVSTYMLATISKNHSDVKTDADFFGNNSEDFKNNILMKEDPTVPPGSLNDSSSEKENVEQYSTEQINSEVDDNNTEASVDEDATVVKFKKPKIAKNIHEVKKIMEARRHLKRMEKKRLKLLIKNHPEECESSETSSSENNIEEDTQVDVFRGFEDDIALEKVIKYDCLIQRLEEETVQLEKSIDYEKVNSNLITSWIDLDPDLDTYIENTLKGKVHRKYRVLLPPICDEYYNYDSEQNVYFLVKSCDDSDQKDIFVDRNLNNLNSAYYNKQEKIISFSEQSKKEEPEPCPREIKEECDYSNKNSQRGKESCVILSDSEDDEIAEENISTSISSTRRVTSDVIASPKVNFSLTFNQTYDEVLKEKGQNSVVPSKREVEEMNKTSQTVVKITKTKAAEQVFMKKLPDSEKVQAPRITRSESTVNGKIIEKSDNQQMPMIRRIVKAKSMSTPSTIKIRFDHVNGTASIDTANRFEENFPMGVSQEVINDVIGVQRAPSDQVSGNSSDQSSQSGEEVSDHRRKRTKGSRQQRYDSSDLYKPRPQLTTRRPRAVVSSPEEPSVPQIVTSRKRSATAELNSSPCKRRR